MRALRGMRPWLESVFGERRVLIGVVHVGALPGAPSHRDPPARLVETAVSEARTYARAGFHGLVIENMHDRPYPRGGSTPEVVACMTAVGREVARSVDIPLGVQILAGANREALAVALACGGAFIRVEGFVFGHLADEGWIESCAADLMRHRRALGASSIRILADIKKKHSAHAVTADVDLEETARAAEFFLADGVVVTGAATGRPADPGEVAGASRAVRIPVFVGSGITTDNIGDFPDAAGFIVGSAVKRKGRWDEPLDASRTAGLARAFRKARAAGAPRS